MHLGEQQRRRMISSLSSEAIGGGAISGQPHRPLSKLSSFNAIADEILLFKRRHCPAIWPRGNEQDDMTFHLSRHLCRLPQGELIPQNN